MDIIILNKSEKPIYEQIYEQVASLILNGELQPGSCLPSIRTLAKDLEISVITVKQAYEMLEENELIYTRAGKGCFVCEHPKKQLTDKKYSLAVLQLKKDLPYYKNLGLTIEEILKLIKEYFKISE